MMLCSAVPISFLTSGFLNLKFHSLLQLLKVLFIYFLFLGHLKILKGKVAGRHISVSRVTFTNICVLSWQQQFLQIGNKINDKESFQEVKVHCGGLCVILPRLFFFLSMSCSAGHKIQPIVVSFLLYLVTEFQVFKPACLQDFLDQQGFKQHRFNHSFGWSFFRPKRNISEFKTSLRTAA